ncbi:hypothetical protein HNO88_002455 [Novosphingobium chloroacetimidivorans]|uniref:Ice-binding protein C-terminal domain-containing protein n=1 Tax=Novosphingobium chloroacetimidivorans TaxID=1428314 RepID=A0A7W7NX74_9SPHN|nr:PEPxxWA-CTERM sorting domain-containing protein [Novosphingobium chloroacetimidivorans]MBB4859129.1 hypothetical protein [Novosphingobium chloroacetimidivorans]
MHRFILAAMAAFAFSAAPAHAAFETTTRLTFNSQGPIQDSFSTLFGGATGNPSAPFLNTYGGPDITPGTTLYGGTTTDDFYADAYFFLGVAPSAAPGGTRRLILGVNQNLAGQSFASLFPTYDEGALIDAIVGLNAGTAPAFGQAFQLVSGFQAQFGPQYAFKLDGTGFLTAFSEGTGFGTITTTQTTEYVPDAVPEPAVWLMMIVGCGVVGVALRRRKPGASALSLRTAP